MSKRQPYYWECEEAEVTVTTARNVLRFYRRANRLQIRTAPRPDGERERTIVGLDLGALAASDDVLTAAALFAEIARNLEDAGDVPGFGATQEVQQ